MIHIDYFKVTRAIRKKYLGFTIIFTIIFERASGNLNNNKKTYI